MENNYEIVSLFPVPLYIIKAPNNLSHLIDFFDQQELSTLDSNILNEYGSRSKNSYILNEPECLELKNFILKHDKRRPLLINDGLFSITRNPNYLGEILLYGSFATLTNHRISYLIVGFAFVTIFPARMFQKEVSLSKKPGFKEYAKQSNVLLPKVCGMNDL